MDPLSISASVASLSGACVVTAKKLFDVVGKFKDAPKTVHEIFSEAKVISLSLSQLHGIFVSDEHTILSEALLTPDVRTALDTALTGCTLTLSCIENETRSLSTKLDRDRKLNFADRSKVVWKDDKFKELLQQLHRQHNVIAILQQGLQMKAIAEIVPLFKTSRATRCIKSAANGTKSLRGLYPQVQTTKSFLESFESANGAQRTFSVISDRQFEFDDVITNSQAYRRVLVAATHTLRNNAPGGQSANQARKLSAVGTSRLDVPSSSATREPMPSADPNNFFQQLRGHLDHVERELLHSTNETVELREKLAEKETLIRALEVDSIPLRKQVQEKDKIIQGLHALMREIESDREELRQSVEHKDNVIQDFDSRLRAEAEAKSELMKRLREKNDEHDKEIEELEGRFENRLRNEAEATSVILKRLEKESEDHHAQEIKVMESCYKANLKAASEEKEEREAQHLKQVEKLQSIVADVMEGEAVKHENMKSELNTSKAEIETANRAAQQSEKLRTRLVREHQHAREQWDFQLQKSKEELRKQSETLDTVLKENDLRDAERRLEIRRQELAKRYESTEESMLGGRFAQVGSVLLIPLHPPPSVGKSRRPQIFEAWIAPEMPEGWISYWEDSQNTWVFVNQHTNEDQFQRPMTPPPKPPKLPENPNLLQQEVATDTSNEILRTISKNTSPMTPPPTPSITKSSKEIFELPATSQTKPLLTKRLKFRGKNNSLGLKSKSALREGEAVTALLEKTANRSIKQQEILGIFRSTTQTNNTKIQVQNEVQRGNSAPAYSGGLIMLCCILIYLLAMVFTEGQEEIVTTGIDYAGYIDFETWLCWFNDQCPVPKNLALPPELALATCAAVID